MPVAGGLLIAWPVDLEYIIEKLEHTGVEAVAVSGGRDP